MAAPAVIITTSKRDEQLDPRAELAERVAGERRGGGLDRGQQERGEDRQHQQREHHLAGAQAHGQTGVERADRRDPDGAEHSVASSGIGADATSTANRIATATRRTMPRTSMTAKPASAFPA